MGFTSRLHHRGKCGRFKAGMTVLVAALNIWFYRDLKKRGATMKETMNDIRQDDPHSWWP
jgi:hypothetical protein